MSSEEQQSNEAKLSKKRQSETAASHLSDHLITAKGFETVSTLINRIRTSSHADLDDSVYVIRENGKLIGVLPISQMLRNDGNVPLNQCEFKQVPTAAIDTDQESVAAIALHHGLSSVPIVDKEDKFVGAVNATSLMHILRREHIEDLHRLAGIQRETRHVREVMYEPPVRQFRHRLPWLAIGFVGSAIATYIASRFEALLSSKIALTFFVPAIVYLADAIGTQTETIIVRGLSLSGAKFKDIFWRELGVGIMLGGFLGAMGLLSVYIGFGSARLALSVGLALFAAGAAATTIGLLLPWCLQNWGKDPALGSGPLATVIQDVLSLLLYLWISSVLI